MPQKDAVSKAVSDAKKALAEANEKFPSAQPQTPVAKAKPVQSKTPLALGDPTLGPSLAAKKANVDAYVNALPKMHTGGIVPKDGPYALAKGELVVPVKESKSYRGVYLDRKKEAKKLEQAFQDGVGPDITASSLPDLQHCVLIMRHGRTALDPIHRSDGWLDFPLSDDGRTRLITAQQYLKDAPIKVIYAPTLKRTTESAEILQSGIIAHSKIEAADEAKTWNMGLLAGTPKKPNKPIVKWFMEHSSETPEGGESRKDFQKRFLSFFEEKGMNPAKAGKGPILWVLSGSNIRELSFQLTGDSKKLDLDEGGLLILRPAGKGWMGRVIFGSKDQNNEWLS